MVNGSPFYTWKKIYIEKNTKSKKSITEEENTKSRKSIYQLILIQNFFSLDSILLYNKRF